MEPTKSNVGRRALLMCTKCAFPTTHVFLNAEVARGAGKVPFQVNHNYICTTPTCRAVRRWGAENPQ